ncbi:DUF5643 domain-containing protein [Lysinibacillus sp. NPDC097195]|uniref:DUF5643 domain-containing protein n=1 Tax=Lysinibacillus sp. NPDC097195 TaxID=3364141 RepID=UPI0038172E78
MSIEVVYEEQPTKNRKRKKWVFVFFGVFVIACVVIASTIVNKNHDAAFSAYKTLVGQTSENEFGQLTLNEVMVDDNQLLLNATFVPAKDVNFNYQIFFFPQVLVNGQNYMVRNGGQTIEQGASTYTIYSSVKMRDLPQDDKLQLEILYNDWNWDKPINEPWTFEIEASQKQLQEDRKVITVDKTIQLKNDTKIKVEKVVTTPISTTIYYETLENANESINFKIVSTAGKTWRQDSSYTLNEQHTKWGIRYDARYLTDKTYKLIPVSADDSQLGPAIQIRRK